jgi:hypothetical protein
MTELLPSHRVIEQVAVGSLNDPEVLTLILGVQELQKQTSIGDTLLDCSALSQGSMMVPISDLADLVAMRGMEPHWREAIVRPHDTWAGMTVDHWEAAANNRGINVRVFRSRESALAWLTTESAT